MDGITYCCEHYSVADGFHTISAYQPNGLTVSSLNDFASCAYVGGLGLELLVCIRGKTSQRTASFFLFWLLREPLSRLGGSTKAP